MAVHGSNGRIIPELIHKREHYSPKPSVVVHCFKFNLKLQQPGERVTNFIPELRQISKFCEYWEMFDDMLHDRLEGDIRQLSIQR